MKRVRVLMVIGLVGCGGAAIEARVAEGTHDEPVPANEARAQVRISVDLERRIGCDEAFDLAIYAHRAVERIAWEAPLGSSSCSGRVATVTFIPGLLPQPELIEFMRHNARSLEVKP